MSTFFVYKLIKTDSKKQKSKKILFNLKSFILYLHFVKIKSILIKT